jgi:hypothetical protein
MNPRIRELTDYLDRERAYLDEALGEFAPDRHNVRPSDEAWCISQVVHHLAQTERNIAGLLERITSEARAGGVTPDADTSPVLPTIEVSPVLDRSRKIRNPRANPSADMTTGDALAALDSARADLKAILSRDDLPNLSQVSAPHPAFGPLNGYQWVAFVAAHVHRHADQIREIGAHLSTETSPEPLNHRHSQRSS